MYKKLLVLLDGSKLAEIVFPYAKELAGRLDMDVILLHVYHPAASEFAPMYKAYVDRAAETLKIQAHQVQDSLGQKEIKHVVVRGELCTGYHAEEILKFAEENAIDLMLMASHGRSGVKRWRMGGVADKILRASKIPVLMVHADAEKLIPYDQWPSRSLLVPLSGSEVSSVVLPHVEALAKQKGAEVSVILMEVVEPPVTPSYYSPELTGVPLNWGQFVEQEMARNKKAAQEYLAGVEKRFKEAGIQVCSIVHTGKPAEEVIAYAKKNPFSVIIMSTHGRTGLSRLVYGSVAESVLFGVSNPMVLVRPQ
ncbi:MAG: universal stress protein [Dehalococcoidia bacterium]|nr:universal stress protein [Dehalococcoidia bacterium]